MKAFSKEEIQPFEGIVYALILEGLDKESAVAKGIEIAEQRGLSVQFVKEKLEYAYTLKAGIIELGNAMFFAGKRFK